MPAMGTKEETLKRLYDKAKRSPKGRLYVYEDLKRELYNIQLNPEEYQTACIEIARLLRI